MAWQDDAACVGQTPLFFGPETETLTARRERERAAKSICLSCSVVEPCRRMANEGDERGIWGGMTERERYAEQRRIILARRRRVVTPTGEPAKHARPAWRTLATRPNVSGVDIRLAITDDGATWHGFSWAVFRGESLIFLAETENDGWLYFHSACLT